MTGTPITVLDELREGRGPAGEFYLGDAPTVLEALADKQPGSVKLIYMDPPFQTGSQFGMRVKLGAQDWRRGLGSMRLPTYRDAAGWPDYLDMMRRVLASCRTLLREDGLLFLHLDERAHARLRLLGDEIFGEKNFLNEIIWVYQSGGRSIRHFSRKHDTILLWSKGRDYGLYMENVMEKPTGPRTNHMKRYVDPDGRVYRSIRSGGKLYTYYDDAPVAPSDVWSNISHLQQRDPERTGYDTQKPLALLDRIVRCGAKAGDIVLDPFAGSSTALEAAVLNGCKPIGIDACPLALNIARRRLRDAALHLHLAPFEGAPGVRAQVDGGVGFYHIFPELLDDGGQTPPEGCAPRDMIEGWSAGYLREDGYHVMAEAMRSRRRPELPEALDVPMYAGQLCLALYDARGGSYYYRL